MIKLTEDIRREATEASERLESAGPEEIVRWAWETLGDRVVLSSSFGADASALLHLVSEVAPEMRVAFLDTGWHFRETLNLRHEIEKKLKLNIVDLKPKGGHEAFLAEHGRLWESDTDSCCTFNKTMPWHRFLLDGGAQDTKGDTDRIHGWMAGLRRESGGVRADIKIIEIVGINDEKTNEVVEFLKIHPMANWTKREIWGHIYKHDVPYHPLTNQGYKSIGCWPCTRAIGDGEDERSGRWSGKQKVECGLHTSHVFPAIEDE